MNAYSSCEKSYNKQLAVSYIVYMMGGSCFHQSICKNQAEERHLFLHFKEMPNQKELDAEEKVLYNLRHLNPAFLQCLSDLKCEVHFRKEEETYVVEFRTGGFEALKACINARGEVEMIPLEIAC